MSSGSDPTRPDSVFFAEQPSGASPAYDMGPQVLDLTKALALADEIDDEEIIRKLVSGR